jgi:hypothetical protein
MRDLADPKGPHRTVSTMRRAVSTMSPLFEALGIHNDHPVVDAAAVNHHRHLQLDG